MKGFALLLAVCISLLAIQPHANSFCFSSLSASNNSCCNDCKESCLNSKTPVQKPVKSCNPFQACSTCIGYMITDAGFNGKAIFTRQILFYLTNDKLISSYYFSCFHPPEFSFDYSRFKL